MHGHSVNVWESFLLSIVRHLVEHRRWYKLEMMNVMVKLCFLIVPGILVSLGSNVEHGWYLWIILTSGAWTCYCVLRVNFHTPWEIPFARSLCILYCRGVSYAALLGANHDRQTLWGIATFGLGASVGAGVCCCGGALFEYGTDAATSRAILTRLKWEMFDGLGQSACSLKGLQKRLNADRHVRHTILRYCTHFQ